MNYEKLKKIGGIRVQKIFKNSIETALPDKSISIRQKLVENAKLGFKKPGKIQRIKKNFQKIGGIRVQKMRHFGLFLKQCGLVFIIGWSTTWPDFIFRP